MEQAELNENLKAEDALQEQARRVEQILKTTLDGYILADTDGQIVDVNPAYCNMIGYTREELLQMNIRQLDGQLSPQEIARRIAQMVEQGGARFETKHKCKDGRGLDLEVSITIMQAETEPLVAAFVRDITAQKHAAEALRESESKFRSVIEQSLDGISVTDEQGLIITWNRSLEQITGLPAGELVGQTIWDAQLQMLPEEQRTPETHARLKASLGEFLRTGTAAWSGRLLERAFNRPDGSRLFVQGVTFPIQTDRGFMLGSITRDITERKRAEDEVRQYAAEVRQYAAEVRQYAAWLEILRAANLALTGSLDLDTVLETLLNHLGRFIPYDSANVMLLEGETHVAVRAMRGYEDWADPERTHTITFDVRTSPTIHTLFTTGESLLIPDTRAYPGWERHEGAEHVLNWMGVPLMAGGQIIGLFSVDKAQVGHFTQEHLRLTEALAPQAAIAIQNARLHEQAQRHVDKLEVRVTERTAELNRMVNLMAGREVRMAELKDVIHKLRAQLEQAGLAPAEDDPLLAGEEQ